MHIVVSSEFSVLLCGWTSLSDFKFHLSIIDGE